MKNLIFFGGTGLLSASYDSSKQNVTEIGRGLNEGWDEWMCEQAGFKARTYDELTDFVRLIESAIGTEKTMELGKGLFVRLFGMPKHQIDYILALADDVYNLDETIRLYNKTDEILNEIEIDKLSKESELYLEYSELIENLKRDPVFVHWTKNNQKELTDKTVCEYLEKSYIPNLKEQKNASIAWFESTILTQYFMEDLDKLFESEEITEENFLKCKKINSFLNTDEINLPDYIKNMEPKIASVRVKEEFSKFEERYLKQLARQEAQKYKNGELGIINFLDKLKKSTENNYFLQRIYINEFAKNAEPKNRELMSNVIDLAYRFYDNDEFLTTLINSSAYNLSSCNEIGECILSNVICGKDHLIDRYNSEWIVDKNHLDNINFDFTQELDDEDKMVIKDFINLRDAIFEKNQDAIIRIASRIIAVQDGEDISFFLIDSGEIVPMEIKEKVDINFELGQRQKKTEEVAMPPVKVGKVASLINAIRRKWHNFKTRNAPKSVPNYGEEIQGKITFSISKHENVKDKYKVNLEKLQYEQQEKIDFSSKNTDKTNENTR